MGRLCTVLAASMGAAAIATLPAAHADDQSFLRYLESYGQSTTAYPYSPGGFLLVGRMICDNLHAGADPLAGASGIDRATWGQVGVDAAQHELCPDTLR